MKRKRYYYKFWLKSSRGTDEVSVRMYNSPQTEETLRADVETWGFCYGAWKMSDCRYGFEGLNKLPKNRKECKKLYDKYCKESQKLIDKKRLYGRLFLCPPFNGQK